MRTTIDGLITVCLILIVFTVGFVCGFDDGKKKAQVQAVKNGCAEWRVSPDGSTQFAWKGVVIK